MWGVDTTVVGPGWEDSVARDDSFPMDSGIGSTPCLSPEARMAMPAAAGQSSAGVLAAHEGL